MRQAEIYWKEQLKLEFSECNLFYSFDYALYNCYRQKRQN